MTTTSFEWVCDDMGPAKVIHIYEPETGLRAIVAIDNVARGPAIGGVRMAPDVDTDEVLRLARAMTLKNAAAGLAHGGGKSGIVADPKKADKRVLLRAFGRAIRELTDYIPGPDMGTDEACMGWLLDEMGRAVGLPRALGGIPLDELGATGYGLVQAAEVAAPFCGLDLSGATVVIQGYGNVGRPAARFLEERGAVLIAASDSRGAVYAPNGMSASALAEAKQASGSVTAYTDGTEIPQAEIFGLECDILIPAARPDAIHAGNVHSVKARLIPGCQHRHHGRGREHPPRERRLEHPRLHRECGRCDLRLRRVSRRHGAGRVQDDR